ncbi:hypothetical protein CYMTET_39246 [Cymbomonas tetramitiformis]|uniref:Uncharacterized protein n=1 Tax=Cymbomonas tetramitiformis TaxID=36881 RepID=A0AAE0CCJ3_9CHLO|nr:hypothetical protein CYMTET_39246 [Cymbomonas tetramitiformis]
MWVPCGQTYLPSAVTIGSSRLRRVTNSSCRTLSLGSLVELRSPNCFKDNWFGVVFKLYFPVKVVDGRELIGRCYWAFGPEELTKVYGVTGVHEIFTGGRRAIYPSAFEFDFAVDEVCNVSFLYPTFLDVGGLNDVHFDCFFDHKKKSLHALDFAGKFAPCLLSIRAALLRNNSCAGRKFFESLESSLTQF